MPWRLLALQMLKVALAQIAPVWLNKEKSLEKVADYVADAGKQKADLVVFGEAIVPGYPFWLGLTGGAEFGAPLQKQIHAHYAKNAIQPEGEDLTALKQLAKQYKTAIYLGAIERAANRGGHSLYCSLIYIDKAGEVQSVHRKLQPTYEERLTWSAGDGHGLRVHPLNEFTVGGLNCWENWMPLPRASLYAQGENLHVAVWPGSPHNTEVTKFLAQEGRSFVVSVSGVMRKADFPEEVPGYAEIMAAAPEQLATGGSCVAAPTGKWLVEPLNADEQLVTAELDIEQVWQERHNFDPSGHYSRPDVTQLTVNRERQQVVKFTGDM
jgi:nitrilase